MTTRQQIEIETTTFVIIAALVGAFFVWRNNQGLEQQFHLISPIVTENNNQTIITPTLNPILQENTASQISPDGTKKLSMKTVDNTDGIRSYVFTTEDGSGANKHQIYTAKASESASFAIPFNAWSPDDKYVFIQKNNSNALVFKATGEPIVSDQPYFDIADIFKTQGKKDIVSEVTGWASPTLLIVNTVTLDNTKGASYWLEVPSKAIIQLSNPF